MLELSQLFPKARSEINPHCLTPAEWLEKLKRGDIFVSRLHAEPKLWLKGSPDALAELGA